MRLIKYINENDKDILIEKIYKDCKPYFDLVKKNKVQNKFLWRGSKSITLKNSFGKFSIRKNREPLDTCITMHKILNKIFKKYTKIKARSETVFGIPNKNTSKVYGKPYILIPVGKFDYIWSKEIDDLYNYIEIKFFDTILKPLCLRDNNYYNEWLNKYGENTENGKWYYNEINTNIYNVEKAKNFIIKDIMKELNISKKESIKIFDETMLKWKPLYNYNEYIKLREKIAVDTLDKIIEKLYIKNKDFKQLMDTYKHEVMINCKYYYLIDSNEIKLIEKLESVI